MSRAAQWSQRLLDSNHGLGWLGVLSFLETLVLPVPIELVMVPYMLARPRRLWWIAGVTTLGCILAAIVGYGIGFFLFDSVGQWALETLGADAAFDTFRERFEKNGFWAIMAIGVTPIPFQVALLAAGMTGYALPLFMAAVTLARGIRYFGLALLVCAFGGRALSIWQRHKLAASAGALVLVAGVFLLVRSFGGR